LKNLQILTFELVSAGLYFNCRVSMSTVRNAHTLTSLSHPADTMMGFCVLGEKRTQEIQSVWQSSYVHRARTQICTLLCTQSTYTRATHTHQTHALHTLINTRASHALHTQHTHALHTLINTHTCATHTHQHIHLKSWIPNWFNSIKMLHEYCDLNSNQT
jgi:hypothetical protein